MDVLYLEELIEAKRAMLVAVGEKTLLGFQLDAVNGFGRLAAEGYRTRQQSTIGANDGVTHWRQLFVFPMGCHNDNTNTNECKI